MKKKCLIVVMLLVVIMTATMLTACNTNKMSLGFMDSLDSKVRYKKVDIVDYEGKTLKEFLENEKSLGAEIVDGWQLVKINGLEPQENEYICIFTSDESKKNLWEGANAPIVIGEITYYESGVGMSDLFVSKDVKYLFVVVEAKW